jgi:MOSC domain-containing protein YiiM
MGALEEGIDHVRHSPADQGRVELIVRRPSENEREVLVEATLDHSEGLVGDSWRLRGSSSSADGGPDAERQLTVMNARAAGLFAGRADRRQLSGDQLYLDIDLSEGNLPAGTRLELGSAVIEITPPPHTGCKKFSARFGMDALRLVSSPAGRQLRLRGANTRVVVPGAVRVGDVVRKLPRRGS